MEEEHQDHDDVHDSDIPCVICRRNFCPEMETYETFDAIYICRDCKSAVLGDLRSNSTPRDNLQRYPRGVRGRQQSNDSVEDVFLQEFSQLMNLARQNRGDRSLFRWQRALSDNDSEGFDQIDNLFGENESNFSFGGYVRGSDASMDGPSNFMDREVLDGGIQILASTDVDPMGLGLDPQNYEDQEDDAEDNNEIDVENAYNERQEIAQENAPRLFQAAGETFDWNNSRVPLAMTRHNGFEEEQPHIGRETDTERIDRIAREIGEIMDRSSSRVSWNIAQEIGYEEESIGEWEEENIRIDGRAAVLETETEYIHQLFRELCEIVDRNNSRSSWESMSREVRFEEENNDEWEEEVASPETAQIHRIFQALSQFTDVDNSRFPWTIPQEDEFLTYSNFFSELQGYEHLNEMNLEELLEHSAEAEGPSRRGAPPASSSFLENLPRLIFSEDQEKTMRISCAICKEPLLAGVKAIQLPCLHFYHSDCILPWLLARNSCPLCRHELPTDDLDYERGKSRYLAVTQVELQAVENSSEESSNLEVDFGVDDGDSNRGVGGRGWLILAAAAPIVGIVGAVLAIWLGKVGRRMGSHGSLGGQIRQVPCPPSSDSVLTSGSERNRRWLSFF